MKESAGMELWLSNTSSQLQWLSNIVWTQELIYGSTIGLVDDLWLQFTNKIFWVLAVIAISHINFIKPVKEMYLYFTYFWILAIFFPNTIIIWCLYHFDMDLHVKCGDITTILCKWSIHFPILYIINLESPIPLLKEWCLSWFLCGQITKHTDKIMGMFKIWTLHIVKWHAPDDEKTKGEHILSPR